ncbi:uncharacterized protein LOC119674367 [Teleopsis dalmanni]|uniref:uncharacterized protein LOC119674367 n=1 Tax=Teleopsis dalmanni TaxID=139649 RepID=UPI0018CCC4F1|nr:uncharacterized protein LOC119674367 [Teleopsis dalmanni]
MPSLLQPVQVQNLVFYPGQEYGIYERPNQHVSNSHNSNNNNNNNAQQNAAIITTGADSNAQQGMSFFNFRPIIDSIFEIPISTLRAVNNMVARLTGSYQESPSGKSAAGLDKGFSSSIDNSLILENGETSNAETNTKTIRKSILREELA